jgi:hypothetical protein
MAISRVGIIGVSSASLLASDLPAGCLPGDVAVVHLARDNSATIPSIDAAWTAVGAGGGSGGDAIAHRGARKVLTASDISSGSWFFSGAQGIVGAVYRGMHQTTPINTIVGGSAGTGNVQWPAITIGSPGTSWVFLAAHTKAFNISTQASTGGDGATQIIGTARGGEHAARDSNGPAPDSSWAQTFVASNSAYQSHGYELVAAASTADLPGGPITLDLGVLGGSLVQPTPIDLSPTPLVLDLTVPASTVEQPIDLALTPVVLDLTVPAPSVLVLVNIAAGPIALDLGVPDPRVAYNEPPPKFIQGAPEYEEWDQAGDVPPLKYQSG